jgi:hypothetical protein
MTASSEHADDCLMRRYLALPDEAREWFPVELGGRPDLCTCGVNPGSNAHRPEVQDVVEELRDRRAAGGKRTVVYLAPDVLEHLAAMQRAAE